jgi:signal transduction histidine kinase
LFGKWFPDHRNTATYDNFDQAFDALTRDEVDMVMGSQNQLLIQTNFRELTGYKTNIVFDFPFESTFGFNKNKDILCSIVDKALRLTNVNEIAAQWTRRTYDYTAKLARAQRPWFIGAIVLLLCVIVVFAHALRLTKKKARAERLAMEASAREQTVSADNAALDRLNRMKSDVIATISHESRTPLAVLASYAGLVSMELKARGMDEQMTADLDKIAFEAQRVANLIDGMSKLSRQKEISSKRTILDISELVRQTARLYEHILERGGVKLEMDAADDLPSVFGNPEELTQVMFNLLQNAKNHTEQGAVTVKAQSGGEFAVVTVTDTGAGIPPSLLPQIFERGISGGEGGSGLGLPICKEIIESHGGEIRVDNKQNKGTAVTFTLPAYKAEDAYGQ